MNGAYFDKFVIFLIMLLIAFAFFLHTSTEMSTQKLKNEEIQKSEQYASKIAQLIQRRTQGDIESVLTRNPQLRVHLNESLQAFLTKQYQYIFVLDKNRKGTYRFLLDGSEEKAEEYKTIFFPKSELFNQVYKTQKMQIVHQSEEGVEHIWLSLVYPMVSDGKTEALLVLDLSEAYGNYLNNFNSPLMRVIWMMQAFLLASLLVLIFLAYRYYRLRHNLLVDKLTSTHTKVFLDEFFHRYKVEDFNAILIDMDNFKAVNKKFSCEFGDILIKEFTGVIKNLISEKSKIIRTGGTEFLIILPKDDTDFKMLVETLFQTLKEKKYLIQNEVISQTVSLSAVDIPLTTTSIRDIQRLLDEKLLEIKSKGKNNFAFLGLNHLNDIKYENINYIKEALEEERLICLYQPIYELKTKEIVKFEALVRLVDKEDSEKFISPYHFMDRIKGTSQYIKMSKLVLQDVFKTLQRYPDIEVSVNIDLNDLENEDMMKLISENLYEHSDIANRVTFEILEDNEVKDYKKVQHIIQQLKTYGSKVALDDFGSGYTNYIYLIGLDIDVLKIDGSLIRELQTSPERAKLVLKSIQSLAIELNVELVAEFISDEYIYSLVKDLGIKYAQGYYLGEPKRIETHINAEKNLKRFGYNN